MNFLEKDLEQIIWESDNEKLKEKGLFISGKKYRQLRIGNYGISDIITIRRVWNFDYNYSFLEITIHEYKKEKIGISAFLQAVGYCKGIQTYLNDRKFYKYTLNIVLCGKNIDNSGNFIYITDLIGNYNYDFGIINNIYFYTYSYSLNGLHFKKEENYNLINKGF